MRSSTGPSLVIMGVDPNMSDDAVVTGIIAGSRELLDERERAQLGSLRAKRLFLGARGGNPDANGARATQASSGTPPRPSRSVRMYADPTLLDRFEAMGHVKLRWATLPCRRYIPRQFFCTICGQLGNHSTDHHRGSFRVAEGRGGCQTGSN